MRSNKKKHPKEKSQLHSRNKHRGRYNLVELKKACPGLAPFISRNKFEDESVDFSNPKAVKLINKALLKHYYSVRNWDIPEGYLCPPIPGRADYIHYAADLLGSSFNGEIPKGNNIRCLDIGVGANCVYPIIGSQEYGWSFAGSDIDLKAIQSAKDIVKNNASLDGKVELRLQKRSSNIFKSIIREKEKFDLVICNPPFHSSAEEANAGSLRKVRNLTKSRVKEPELNFGGQNKELWCRGGEIKFVRDMIFQSKQYSEACFWFTSLVSKQTNLRAIYSELKKVRPFEFKTIEMAQGNKVSRIVAWTFLTEEQQKEWISKKWGKKNR